MPKPVVVSKQVLSVGASAALDNARRLLDDAELLWSSGSAPTAQALSILAIEEAAKASIWSGLARDAEGDVTLTEENHKPRLRRAREVLSLLDAFLELIDPEHPGPLDTDALKAAVDDDNAAKMRGFYVDAEGEDLHLPQEVTREEGRGWLDLATVFLRIVEDVGMAE